MGAEQTYKRGQVEWALWRFHSLLRLGMAAAPPPAFGTRIKRLLELDRAGGAPHAFVDAPPAGRGEDAPYTAFNAVCLMLGLDLLDAGFKQSEAVFLLRHLRPDLEAEYARILRAPPPNPRRRVAAARRPGCPAYEERGRRWADCRVFVVIRKIEMKEAFPALEGKLAADAPLILEPVFCRGAAALGRELHRMGAADRTAFVLEIAHAAAAVTALLERAPAVRRGRR